MTLKEQSGLSILSSRFWLIVSVCGLAAALSLGWHVYAEPSLLRGRGAALAVSLVLCLLFAVPACIYAITAAVMLANLGERLGLLTAQNERLHAQNEELEQAHLRQRARIDDLATLREIALIVNRETDFSIIAEKAMDLLGALLEPRRATLFIIDQPGGVPKPFADYADGKVRTGRRMQAADLPRMPVEEFERRSVVAGVRGDAFYTTVPLKVGDEVFGCLLVVFPLKGRTSEHCLADFNEHQRDFLLNFAQHISLAVKTKHLQFQMVLDGLTGLYTKSHFQTQIESHADFARRHADPFSLVVIDIDHFKKVNDTYGHSTGDLVLTGVASTLLHSLRKYDSAYRTGGEEMAVLLPRTDLKRVAQIAERLRSRIEKETFAAADGRHIRVTASCGASQYRQGEPPEALFERCDRNLYAAKQSGRNRVVADEAGA